MLTLLSIPKPFAGPIRLIQRNAIQSWLRLHPTLEVILFGDDEGTEEAATEFQIRHVPEVARNEYGTPLVSDVFGKAQRLASHDLLCYVNADILLMSDLVQAIEQVAGRQRHFLMVGQRWDLNVAEPLSFEAGWEERLRTLVLQTGKSHGPTGIDYFVFRRGLWPSVPPFALGRTAWDNWLLYDARSRGARLIDASPVVMAVHQNHDYSHCPGGMEGVWEGAEAQRNLELAGGPAHVFTLEDATHVLTLRGLRGARTRRHLRRRLDTAPLFHPCLDLPVRLLLKVIAFSRSASGRLGSTSPTGGNRNA